MSKEAGKTASGPTVLIAIEQYFPKSQRIIDDEIAYRVLSPGFRAFAQLMRPQWARNLMIRRSDRGDFPGMWGGMLCRKRYIDDKLHEAVADMDAIVNLGAGMDTRSYRSRFPTNAHVWEVDQPEVIEQKKDGLKRALQVFPSNVTLVPVDFDHEDLGEVLNAQGYSLSSRTFFILEGVTQYVTEKGLRATFDFLATASSGSRLAFTYVRKDFIDGRNMHGWPRAYKKFVQTGVWLLGLEPEGLAAYLKGYGWQLMEDRGYDELAKVYINPTRRTFATTTVERVAYAEKL